MNKIMLQVENTEFKDGDILIWKKDKFIRLSKTSFLQSLSNEIEELNININSINEVLKIIDLEIKKIKTELAYNRGDITEEEYKELCGLNK